MRNATMQIGRVIRVGRGWVDVMVDRRARRICTRPDLLVTAGNYVKIVNEQGVAVLSADQHQPSELMQ